MTPPAHSTTVQTLPGAGMTLASREIPPVRPWEVLIRTHVSYISAGTEIFVVRQARARAAGFEEPMPLGYSLAGSIVATGSEVGGLAPGTRVAAIGTGAFHSEYVVVSERLVVPLSEGVSAKDAAPMAMMGFAVEAVRKAGLVFGQNVVVVGGGPMGQYVSQMSHSAGCHTLLIDPVPTRLAVASRGVETLQPGGAMVEAIRKTFGATGVEVVFLCFGGDGTAMTKQLFECMSRGPDGIIQGRFVCPGGVHLTLEMASASGNLEFVSSAKAGPGYRDSAFEGGADYTAGYVPWTVSRNLRVLERALATGLLSSTRIITHEFAFDAAPDAYACLEAPPDDMIGTVLRYS